MRPSIIEMAPGSFRASIGPDAKADVGFFADGPDPRAAEDALRERLREHVRLGNAAQRLLYFMTDAPSGTSNDGA